MRKAFIAGAIALSLGACMTVGGTLSTSEAQLKQYCPLAMLIVDTYQGAIPASKQKAYDQVAAATNIACLLPVGDPVSLAITVVAALAAAQKAGLKPR